MYYTCECPSLPSGWVNGHVSDIKAWLKLKLIASTQLSFLPKLLLEMKVNGLEDTLLHVIVSFYPHRTRRPLNLEQSRFFLRNTLVITAYSSG